MKKLTGCLLLLIVLLAACQDDEWNSNERVNPHKELIDGAREYFEQTIFEAATRGELVEGVLWHPGDVTPAWNHIRIKKNEKFDLVMVPIYADNNYIAQQKVVINEKERHYLSKVWQYLCVRKNKEGKYSAAYVTVVPHKGYYDRNRNQVLDKLLDADTYYGDFTGHVLYNDLVNFSLLAADKVKDGKLHWGFDRQRINTKETFLENYHKMFGNISLLPVVATKNTIDGGELEDVVVIWCRNCQMSVETPHFCDNSNSGSGNDDDNDNDNDNGNLWNDNDSGDDSGWYNGGGGGSGNNNSGNSNQTPAQRKAKSVFKYSNLGSLENRLISLVEQMMADCMANALLNAMEGRNVSLINNSSLSPRGQYNGTTNTLSLRVWDDPALLVHELLHAYQYANGGFTTRINGGNMEVEAQFAQYAYEVRKDPNKRKQYIRDKDDPRYFLLNMEKSLNKNFTIKKNKFWTYYDEYAKLVKYSAPSYGFDSSYRNIDNLTRLSSGC